ncbi:phage integrase family protein [Arthrobacter sp. ERGS1:01]|uniref:phage integrase family protein n=1 Tax=Arthrobacter sp. ERGS1:01 TaxID=1704044 RepID=UPI00123727CC|nr:phage integrase family protein [Arthrobacter sp. ERGS1:01]
MATGARPLSLTTVAALPQTNATGYLAALLMESGTVPEENFDRIRMEIWERDHFSTIENRENRNLLRQYATWVINPLFSDSAIAGPVLENKRLARSKRQILLVTDWLRAIEALGFDLSTVPQRVFDEYVATHGRMGTELTPFMRWAKNQRQTRIRSHYFKAEFNAGSVSEEQRWAWIKMLLHESELKIAARVAGLFCLAYGLSLTRVIGLRMADLSMDSDPIRVTFGKDPVELPAAVGQLVKDLANHNSSNGFEEPSWLFKGKQPGRSLTTAAISGPLRKAGIHLQHGKGAAMMILSRDVPPSILADLLGISITAAIRWAGVSGHDWVDYPRLRMNVPANDHDELR